MTTAVALLLLSSGVAVWPVPTAAERRLDRLRRIARVAPDRLVALPVLRADRARAVAIGVVVLAALLAGLSGGSALGLAAAAAAGAVAVVVTSARGARQQAARRRDLVTALAVLRGELDAGAPFVDALVTTRDRAGAAASAFDLGGGGPDPGRPDVLAHARRCLTAGAALVAVTGAPWSAVATGIARDVAAHDAREREVAAALAGARASTVVLGGLPVLGLGLAVALGADPAGFLLHTPAGRWVLAAGTTLDLLGVVVSTVVAARAAR